MTVVLCVVALLLMLGFLYLLAICPGRRRDTAAFRRVRFAHRGFHTETGEAPENSLPAFRRAREAGFGVELDIQFTADRQIVVFHDGDLTRMCGVPRKVAELNYGELRQLSLQGGEEHIPLLCEVLRELGDTPVICEVKSYGNNGDTSLCEAAWPLLESYPGPMCIESFNPMMVRWFRKHHPEMIRGILAARMKKGEGGLDGLQAFFLSALLSNFLTRPDFVAFSHKDTGLLSFRLCRSIFHPMTVAWTIVSSREEEQSRRWFDTVIFEQYRPE